MPIEKQQGGKPTSDNDFTSHFEFETQTIQNRDDENVSNIDVSEYSADLPQGVFVSEALPNTIKMIKDERRNEYIIFGVISVVFFIILYIVIKRSKDKKDPIKNLDNLKDKNLISEDEYLEKKQIIKLVNESEKGKKEREKLLFDLKNLKNKGVLSEKEYLEKINLVNINA